MILEQTNRLYNLEIKVLFSSEHCANKNINVFEPSNVFAVLSQTFHKPFLE